MSDRRIASDAALLRSALSALQRRLRAQDGADAIPPTSLAILGQLLRSGVVSASEIAQREGLQPQSLTRALKSLEDDGLIDRWTDEDDRRRTSIAITGKGEALLRGTIRNRVAWLTRAMASRLNPAEHETLRAATALLERLAGEGEPKQAADGVFNLIPYAHVADVMRSLEFYALLGFVEDGRVEDGGCVTWASMHGRTARAARIMFERAHAPIAAKTQGVLFYCWTDGIATIHARLTNAGRMPGAIAHPPHMENGEFAIDDPDGYRLLVGQLRRPR
jgi:DNA-binding MarR family transcriptional regulator